MELESTVFDWKKYSIPELKIFVEEINKELRERENIKPSHILKKCVEENFETAPNVLWGISNGEPHIVSTLILWKGSEREVFHIENEKLDENFNEFDILALKAIRDSSLLNISDSYEK